MFHRHSSKISSDGWTNLEAVIALFIIMLASAAIMFAGVTAVTSAKKISEKTRAIISERNKTAQSILAYTEGK